MIRALLLALVVSVAAGAPAGAHQASMAILEAREIGPGTFALRWENRPTEADGDDFVAVGPLWPEGCASEGAILSCGPEGLTGEVGFEGLGRAQSAATIRVVPLEGATRAVLLTPSQPTAQLSVSGGWRGALGVGRTYAGLGMEHIAGGIDHLLFVLALVVLAGPTWRLVRTITAFTLAHTVSLGLVSFGVVAPPGGFVEAMIALSIALVAAEIVQARRGRAGLALRRPEAVAFGFGLLHGLGFAGALLEMGLPDGARLWALAAFNVGVEAGQLLFVAVLLALVWAWRASGGPALAGRLPAAPAGPRADVVVAYGVGLVAAFWFAERMAAVMSGA